MEPTTREYCIPECNVERLLDKLNKLNHRIAKKGLDAPPVTMTWLRSEFKPTKDSDGSPTGRMGRYEVYAVEGCAPSYNGWHLIAKLTDAQYLYEGAEGTVVSMVPGEPELGPEWRHEAIRCDHCRSYRKRRDTFLVKHDDGRLMQVGRSCLKDFLGHKSPEAIASMCEYVLGFMAGYDDEEGFGGVYTPDYHNTRDFLAYAAMAIRKHGWCSKRDAEIYCRESTVNMATAAMFEKPTRYQDIETPDPADYGRVDTALQWVQDTLCTVDPDTLNDYMYKLRLTCEAEYVSSKSFGICASLLPTVECEMMKKLATENSEYVGEVGKRQTFDLKLIGVREFEGGYGLSIFYSFVDDTGNQLNWFASSRQEGLVPSANGIRVKITGTVKAHKEYKGIKQTTLTRCKVESVGA